MTNESQHAESSRLSDADRRELEEARARMAEEQVLMAKHREIAYKAFALVNEARELGLDLTIEKISVWPKMIGNTATKVTVGLLRSVYEKRAENDNSPHTLEGVQTYVHRRDVTDR